jgi:hypothetical protein
MTDGKFAVDGLGGICWPTSTITFLEFELMAKWQLGRWLIKYALQLQQLSSLKFSTDPHFSLKYLTSYNEIHYGRLSG